MKKRIKKAALIAASGYLAVTGLGFGMLKAAQETRRTLYGGKPVMAALTQPLHPQKDEREYLVQLGGGEWEIPVTLPNYSGAGNAAAQLPPCTGKLFVHMFLIADRFADQTAEWIAVI